MTLPGVTVAPARPEQRAAAFGLVFRHVPEEERARRVDNALWLMDRGEFPSDGLFVASRAGHVLGALVCQPVPGAAALVWPPGAAREAADAPPQAVEDLLLTHAVAWLQGRGVKLAQTLLAAHEQPLAAPLLRHGFHHITRLWFLEHDLTGPLPRGCGLARFESLAESRHDKLFEETLLATYGGTRDCPELNGVRSAEAILEGHRAQGKYDPRAWWLAWREGRPAGVLLLTEQPDLAAWDVSYMGVVPEARRRGLGRELVTHALQWAAWEGAPRLTLSVDARNEPAWELYFGLGFRKHDEREVYLTIWP